LRAARERIFSPKESIGGSKFFENGRKDKTKVDKKLIK
jgi:hypothetical protein